MEKKTRELFGYSFAQWKWNVQDPGNFGKFSVFRIFQIFQNFQFLQHSILNMIAGKLEWGSRLDESSRRKPGWRFTAGFQYGCSAQLVGGQKKVELFIILGAFLFKLMNSFMVRCCHWYFCHQVQWKRKLGSYSAIHLLDESEMSRTREILVNL